MHKHIANVYVHIYVFIHVCSSPTPLTFFQFCRILDQQRWWKRSRRCSTPCVHFLCKRLLSLVCWYVLFWVWSVLVWYTISVFLFFWVNKVLVCRVLVRLFFPPFLMKEVLDRVRRLLVHEATEFWCTGIFWFW